MYARRNYKRINSNKNNDCITIGGVLAWAKRVEVQRAQATVLNMLTESRQFQKSKGKQNKNINAPEQHTMTTMQILWWDTSAKKMPSIWQDMHRVQQNWTVC